MSDRDNPAPPSAGHADSPRQDSQRPSHRDRGDVGGQESTNERAPVTHVETPGSTRSASPAADAPPPVQGRQPQRGSQAARNTAGPGVREEESLKSEEPEGFGKPGPRRPATGLDGPGSGR